MNGEGRKAEARRTFTTLVDSPKPSSTLCTARAAEWSSPFPGEVSGVAPEHQELRIQQLVNLQERS